MYLLLCSLPTASKKHIKIIFTGRARKMAQWVKMPSAKLAYLSWIPATSAAEGETQLPQVAQVNMHMCLHDENVHL